MTQTEPVTLTARKCHQCDWCGEGIEIGARYTRWRWFDVRDAYTVKMHPECREAFRRNCDIDFDGCWVPGDYRRGCHCQNGTKECDCEYGERMRAKEAP